ncbi:Replication factor A protein 3 family protein [Babesia bovis T2Bo]|uniref:Replication factor A protein 3 family protein n=1 Tax=Babesia bovis T2Bo TaxID=484906 RepID=UPI001C351518|nr:Replication factor A protein 3 family protein [Babesia bovis T2Bo]KAG6440127.1 Replication factor A protein 3 family protein [Babesia bovis T2Bo]
MGEDFLSLDTKSQIPPLCNFETMKNRIGTSVRVIGQILSSESNSLVLQTSDGAKISCIFPQDAAAGLSGIVELYAVVASDDRQRGHGIYLQQYGDIHKWEDEIDMSYINKVIVLSGDPRFAKYMAISTAIPEGINGTTT